VGSAHTTVSALTTHMEQAAAVLLLCWRLIRGGCMRLMSTWFRSLH
jgi:hypothetical protein